MMSRWQPVICLLSLLVAIQGAPRELLALDNSPLGASTQNEGGIRPIIFMHGIFGEGHEVDFARQYIPKVSIFLFFHILCMPLHVFVLSSMTLNSMPSCHSTLCLERPKIDMDFHKS